MREAHTVRLGLKVTFVKIPNLYLLIRAIVAFRILLEFNRFQGFSPPLIIRTA